MKVPILLLLLAVILFKNECIGQRTTPLPLRPTLAQNGGRIQPTRTTPKAGGAGRPTSQKTTPGRATAGAAQSGRLVVTTQPNANGRTTPRGGNQLQRTTARTNQGTSARTTFAAGRTTPRVPTGSGRTTPRGPSGITTARNAKLQQTTTKRGAGTTTRRAIQPRGFPSPQLFSSSHDIVPYTAYSIGVPYSLPIRNSSATAIAPETSTYGNTTDYEADVGLSNQTSHNSDDYFDLNDKFDTETTVEPTDTTPETTTEPTDTTSETTEAQTPTTRKRLRRRKKVLENGRVMIRRKIPKTTTPNSSGES